MVSKSDLKLPELYERYVAAAFFKRVNEFTNAMVNSGHIGTSNIMDASKWGPTVSVWPLDNNRYNGRMPLKSIDLTRDCI